MASISPIAPAPRIATVGFIDTMLDAATANPGLGGPVGAVATSQNKGLELRSQLSQKVLRFTWRDVTDRPSEVAAAVRTLME